MNLYEIDNEILGCVDAETGEIFDEEKFESLAMERDKKLENIALWIKNLTAEAAALKAEKQAFADRQKAAENKIESLKSYMSAYLAGAKFETSKVKVSFRKSEYLDIAEGAAIPEQFLKYKEPDIDKTELKRAIKAGTEIPGVTIEERKNIQIK